MKFIKKKNMLEGEELLYLPRLHWFYTVKHLVLSLPFYAALLALWLKADSLSVLPALLSSVREMAFKTAVKYAFIASLLVMLVIFICRIFLYLSTEYGVTNKRLILKRGIFRLSTAEIPTDRIESIHCAQGIFGMMFHYGTLRVSGVGGKAQLFHMAAKPYALRRRIADIIEKNKAITVIHGNMPLPRPQPAKKPVPEPIYRYGTFVRVLQPQRAAALKK